MSNIITVTANTAIDLLTEAEGLAEHDAILAKKSSEFACSTANVYSHEPGSIDTCRVSEIVNAIDLTRL
ncbi:MAG: hypothetical protein ACU83V_04540 [Gammaproteobacteria bacterium]